MYFNPFSLNKKQTGIGFAVIALIASVVLLIIGLHYSSTVLVGFILLSAACFIICLTNVILFIKALKFNEKYAFKPELPKNASKKDRSLFNALNTVFTVLWVAAVLLIAIAIVLFLNT